MSDYGVSIVTKFGLGDVIRQPYCLLRQPRIPLGLQDIACGWQAVEATSFDYYRELPESARRSRTHPIPINWYRGGALRTSLRN